MNFELQGGRDRKLLLLALIYASSLLFLWQPSTWVAADSVEADYSKVNSSSNVTVNVTTPPQPEVSIKNWGTLGIIQQDEDGEKTEEPVAEQNSTSTSEIPQNCSCATPPPSPQLQISHS